MCGILGILNFGDSVNFEKSASSIKHRGPDADGFYRDSDVYFYHSRLSIIDLSEHSNQPFLSLDENYIIIFNGEIYNYVELRNLLLDKGYLFRGDSDTEVLLNGYIEFGKEILLKLNGIFSFAVYDKLRRTVFIARDHFGVKPLYYFVGDNFFCFSSELKAIINVDGVNKDLSIDAFYHYVKFLYCPSNDTPFLTY